LNNLVYIFPTQNIEYIFKEGKRAHFFTFCLVICFFSLLPAEMNAVPADNRQCNGRKTHVGSYKRQCQVLSLGIYDLVRGGGGGKKVQLIFLFYVLVVVGGGGGGQ